MWELIRVAVVSLGVSRRTSVRYSFQASSGSPFAWPQLVRVMGSDTSDHVISLGVFPSPSKKNQSLLEICHKA